MRPGQSVVCAYQYGAIGPDRAMMTGAGAAAQRGIGSQAAYRGAPVLCVTSDAGAAYGLFEMDTAAKYKIPVIAAVYNNNSWGLWPSAAGSARSMHMYLFQENLRCAGDQGIHVSEALPPRRGAQPRTGRRRAGALKQDNPRSHTNTKKHQTGFTG